MSAAQPWMNLAEHMANKSPNDQAEPTAGRKSMSNENETKQLTPSAPAVGSSDMVRSLYFACGATYEVKGEPPKTRTGKLAQLMTHAATVGVVVKGPLLRDGNPAPCLWGCPTPGRHRKEQRGWFGENAKEPKGEPVLCVLCRPTHISPNKHAEPRPGKSPRI